MTRTLFIWTLRTLTVAGLSSTCWAGGHGAVMFRPGGFHAGGAAMGRALPPVAGTWHVRSGQAYVTPFGQGGRAFGHTNTAFVRPDVNAGFGHTNTAWVGRPNAGIYGHTQTAGYGVNRVGGWTGRNGVYPGDRTGSVRYGYGYGRGRYGTGRFGYGYGDGYGRTGYGYGRYAPDLTGGGYGFSYGYGGAAAPAYAGGVVSGYGGSVVEVPLSAQYGEAPLNQGDTVYTGAGNGPVRMVSAGAATCTCARTSTPAIYRFGVGSYY